jgi:hypothetical protein
MLFEQSTGFKMLIDDCERNNILPEDIVEIDTNCIVKAQPEYRIVKEAKGTLTREPIYGWGSVKVGRREQVDNDLPFEHTVEAGVKIHRRSGDA